ncbi:MAG: hypothetical protein WC916_07840 [Candidatus Woesearchaeota archaeon]
MLKKLFQPKMKVIQNPKENIIKQKTTSVLISRTPAADGAEFKTAIIRFYTVNNPHKTTEFPTLTYEFSNIEKVRIMGLNVSYYLEGNDIVINDLEEIYITHEGIKILLKGYQHLVEKRQ